MKLTIDQIIKTAHCEVLVSPGETDTVLTSLENDSRLVMPGALFVAIKGEKVNGNNYIIEAFEAGAKAAIASEAPSEEVLEAARKHGALLLRAANDDELEAILELARNWRENLKATVVGVTGSTGKTTTKDLIANVVSRAYATQATRGNRNSEIGLAEIILDTTENHDLIICEMGMQALGEIDRLCKAASPLIGVVTNIGVAHCELLGSRENIALAKAELLISLPDQVGVAILPGDDPYTPKLREFARLDERQVSQVTYGLGEQNDIRATNISYDEMGYPSFDIWTPDGRSYPVRLGLQGEHNILNALAAVAVGLRVGVAATDITRALAEAKPAALRQELIETDSGDIILNDTYNANPDSMRAALSLLKRLASATKRIAVLGDMYELGSEEVSFHRQIGEYAFVNGVDELIAVGKLGKEIATGALAVGMPTGRVHSCADVDEALEVLKQLKQRHVDASSETGDANCCIILVKASRGMQLERIVEGFAGPKALISE